MSRSLHFLALALVGLLCACTRYSTAEDETRIRCTADDALEIVEIQRGLGAKPNDLPEAVALLTRVLSGAKVFPLEMQFLDLDHLENLRPDQQEQVREMSANLKIGSARLFRDDRQQLCLIRTSRVERLARTLEIANALVNVGLLEDKAKFDQCRRPFKAEFPIFDEATRDAIWSEAARGHAWVRYSEGALELDFPCSDDSAAASLRALASGEVDEFGRQLLSQATRLRVADGRVVLRFCDADKPALHLALELEKKPVEPEVDETLVDALSKAGLLIGTAEEMKRALTEIEQVQKSTNK